MTRPNTQQQLASLEKQLDDLAGKHRAAYIGVVPVAGGQLRSLSNTATTNTTADFLLLISGIVGGFNVAQAKVRDGCIKLSPDDAARLGQARNATVALGSFLLNSMKETKR